MLVSNPLQSCITFGQISTIILHTQNWVMLSTCVHVCTYVCVCVCVQAGPPLPPPFNSSTSRSGSLLCSG